jgi:predicted TPR repeat methyltransferase
MSTNHPSQANATFDTSLIDLSPKIPPNEQSGMTMTEADADATFQDSFSTTDTAPSDDYKQAIRAHQEEKSSTERAIPNLEGSALTPIPLSVSSKRFKEASATASKMPVRYVPTVEAYDAWADVYDSDGNILQSIDDHELSTLLPSFVKMVSDQAVAKGEMLVKVVDLGCGTGRNTVKLLASEDWDERLSIEVTGIDASRGMLTIAEAKLEKARLGMGDLAKKRSWKLIQHDFLDPVDASRAPVLLPQSNGSSQLFNALITTLVLEHFPLAPFFKILSSLLIPSSHTTPSPLILLTNMHQDMGSQSQAGFVSADEDGTAVKVRGTSWAHGVQETADAARNAELDVVGSVVEKGVEETMVGSVVGERGRKWVGVKVWYGMVLRRKA